MVDGFHEVEGTLPIVVGQPLVLTRRGLIVEAKGLTANISMDLQRGRRVNVGMSYLRQSVIF